MWWPWVQYPAEKSTTHLLSHFGTSFACHHLFCNDYPFLRQGLIQQIRLNLFRSVTTCREMLAPSNDWLLIGQETLSRLLIGCQIFIQNPWHWLGDLAAASHFEFISSVISVILDIYEKSFKHCNTGYSFQVLGHCCLWLGKGFCQLKESWSIWSTLLFFTIAARKGNIVFIRHQYWTFQIKG